MGETSQVWKSLRNNWQQMSFRFVVFEGIVGRPQRHYLLDYWRCETELIVKDNIWELSDRGAS